MKGDLSRNTFDRALHYSAVRLQQGRIVTDADWNEQADLTRYRAERQARDTIGNFRLEVTAELRLRDQMYADQQTPQWKERYKIRSGIEATNSELKRCYGIGKLRVRRMAKVLFAVSCKLMACNVKRWAKAHFAFFKWLLQYLLDAMWRFIQNKQVLSSENRFCSQTCVL